MVNKNSVFYNKSNLEILQDIKKAYKPSTAFGNVKLITLLNSIKCPNKDGYFETIAAVEKVKILNVSWKCVDCGCRNFEQLDYNEVEEDDIIERTCSCGKEHKLTITQ